MRDLMLSRVTEGLRKLRLLKRRFGRSTGQQTLNSLKTAVAILQAQQEATLDGILVVSGEGKVLSYNRRFLELWTIPPALVSRGSDRELLDYVFGLVLDLDDFRRRVDYLYAHPDVVSKGDIIQLKDGRILSRNSVPVQASGAAIDGRAWYFTEITESRRTEAIQSALFQIGELTRAARDLDELYGSIHKVVGTLMDATNFYIALEDAETGLLSFPYFVDEVDKVPASLDPRRGLTGYVFRSGNALLAPPSRFHELIASGEVEQIGAPSVDWLGVPLKSGDKTFGVLGIQSYRESVRYGETEKGILQFVSQQVSSAIEQKQRENALKASERRYRQMFENNRAVQILIDPDRGVVVDANNAACDFYGYSYERLAGMRVSDLNTLTEAEIRIEMLRALSQKRTFFDFKHRLSSGEIRDVEVHSGPLEVHGRTLLYSIVHDVTERKQAERALQTSEEKFRNIVDFAPVGIYQSTEDGTFITANKALAAILGYDRVEELLALNLSKDVYFDPSDRATLVAQHRFDRDSIPTEVLWKKKDGNVIWVQLTVHGVGPADRRYFEGFVADITQRKRAETMLQSQSAAIRASLDGVALLDSAGCFTYMNEAHARVYGYSAEELVGRSWNVLYDKAEDERFSTEIMPRFWREGKWRGEAVGTRSDGTTFPQEVSLTALDDGGLVCVIRDITERTYAEEQIKHLAYHDALTGLPNRLLFRDRLGVSISQAQRSRSKLAVLFFDLDRFKTVNDSLGHNSGDQLLQSVAARIHFCIRESDTVARQGGDEFTVLLPMLAQTEDAARIAEKILQAIREPFYFEGRALYVTTSIGISVFPDDGADSQTLIKNADTAMYQAKELGRDNYQLFNAIVNARALERLSMESDLRRALEQDQFIVYYQPIYGISSDSIHGMEALLRWNHPRLGLVSPSEFIHLAESCGLMPGIGAWAMETACRQTVAWQRKGLGPLSLAVNLSVSQLQHPDLVVRVSQILKDTAIRPEDLELEITESSAMENPEQSARTLETLKKLGLRVSLDDFGTGHSSLSYLKRFPIDTLKIDQSFISDLSVDPESGAIVEAIIAMAHSIRLKVIAEGVELLEQRMFLEEHSCDQMQGFLMSRPLPAEEFEKLLSAGR